MTEIIVAELVSNSEYNNDLDKDNYDKISKLVVDIKDKTDNGIIDGIKRRSKDLEDNDVIVYEDKVYLYKKDNTVSILETDKIPELAKKQLDINKKFLEKEMFNMERIVIPIFSAKDGEGNNIFEDNYEIMRLSCIYTKDDSKDNIIKAIYDIKKELNDCDIMVYKDTAYIYNKTGDFIDTLDVYENIPKIVKIQLELNKKLQ